MSDLWTLEAALDWWLAVGVDELVADEPLDRFAASEAAAAAPRPAQINFERPQPTPLRPVANVDAAQPVARAPQSALAAQLADAEAAAAGARTLAELRAAVDAFPHCALRDAATHTVFADGNPQASVMLIGEAPGAEEDKMGLPFVGASGQFLDRMLAAIGIDRTTSYITNVVFWRPPGNRNPTDQEVALCRPFVLRHIALVRPRILVLVGGVATRALIPETPGIMRARGRWNSLVIPGLAHALPALPMYHPSFLLRSPERKRDAWIDLLTIKVKLREIAVDRQ